MTQGCQTLALVVLMTGAGVGWIQQPESWIDFKLSGTVSLAGRERDVVSCNENDDGMQIRATGDWKVTFDVPSAAPGRHEARVHVSAPESVTALHDRDPRTDDHLTGRAVVTGAPAGTGAMGLPLLRVEFDAPGLTSGTGVKVDLTGVLVCPVS